MSTGHRDCVVVKDLVGDVHPGGDGRTNRQYAGVEISAVAQVLKYVLGIGKRCLTDPGRALATHLGEGMRGAIWHPRSHVVTTNTAQRMTALGHFGRGVMRASGTKVRNAFDGLVGRSERLFFFLNPTDTLLQ